jgi:serpin B
VVVQVDEEGTEAAAVTAVVMLRCAMVPAPPPQVVFDRPFLFVIVDDATSTPLFVGLVMNPAAGPS